MIDKKSNRMVSGPGTKIQVCINFGCGARRKRSSASGRWLIIKKKQAKETIQNEKH